MFIITYTKQRPSKRRNRHQWTLASYARQNTKRKQLKHKNSKIKQKSDDGIVHRLAIWSCDETLSKNHTDHVLATIKRNADNVSGIVYSLIIIQKKTIQKINNNKYISTLKHAFN